MPEIPNRADKRGVKIRSGTILVGVSKRHFSVEPAVVLTKRVGKLHEPLFSEAEIIVQRLKSHYLPDGAGCVQGRVHNLGKSPFVCLMYVDIHYRSPFLLKHESVPLS